jgi:hypothetical protein
MLKSIAIKMSYEVSDVEKQQAERAVICFNAATKALEIASDHLNVMKTPFKNSPDMSPEDVMNARAAIRRFRDKVIENFNNFKKVAFRCVDVMQVFSSDTQTLKIMKSFISSIDGLEAEVNKLSDLFNNLKDKDFSKNIVESIESIQKQCTDIEELIEDRIKTHINNNILAANWVDATGNDLQMKIEKKKPLILDLFNARQEQLNDAIKDPSHLNK